MYTSVNTNNMVICIYLCRNHFVVVCAIDIGTTYSGYAFGFLRGGDDLPEIFINKIWGQNIDARSPKTPTCVLTGPGDKFVDFGYEAEEK